MTIPIDVELMINGAQQKVNTLGGMLDDIIKKNENSFEEFNYEADKRTLNTLQTIIDCRRIVDVLNDLSDCVEYLIKSHTEKQGETK